MTNRIPELQQYLHDRGEPAKGDYSNLEKAGVGKAVAYMRGRAMEKAKDMLAKLVKSAFILNFNNHNANTDT